jgi:hypothetical protein
MVDFFGGADRILLVDIDQHRAPVPKMWSKHRMPHFHDPMLRGKDIISRDHVLQLLLK